MVYKAQWLKHLFQEGIEIIYQFMEYFTIYQNSQNCIKIEVYIPYHVTGLIVFVFEPNVWNLLS